MSVLSDLVEGARARARALPRREPSGRVPGPRFDDVLRGKERLSVIAEFKQASPSLGTIAQRNLEERVKCYESAGAAAVSVVTEPTRFRGSLMDLERAAQAVRIPVLMKDFIVDEAQVRMAAAVGARAVLLIVRCLSRSELLELAAAAEHYGLVPMVECHHEDELDRALEISGAVIGVNNRDLATLEIETDRAPRLLSRVPAERVVVAESGYERGEDLRDLRGLADAVLMGSVLMKQDDPTAFIRSLVT